MSLHDEAHSELRKAKADMYHVGELGKIQYLLKDVREPPYEHVRQMVLNVVETRHNEESMDLCTRHMTKQALLISANVAALQKQHQVQIQDAKPEERPMLQTQHADQLAAYEAEQRKILELEAEKELATLRKKHSDEIFTFVREVTPEFIDEAQAAQQAAHVHAEMAAAKWQNEAQLPRKLDTLLENLAGKKEEEMEAEIEAVEAELHAEEVKDMQKMAKRMQDIAVRKQHAITQMKKEHEAEMNAAPADQQKSLSLQHDEQMRNMIQALDEEERKQQEAMTEQVNKHQEGRRRVRLMALEQKKDYEYRTKADEMRKEKDQIVAQQAETMAGKERELAALQDRLRHQSATFAGTKFAALKRTTSDMKTIRIENAEAVQTASPQQEEVRRVAEAVTQPLMQRMEALEAMLKDGHAAKKSTYHDMRDTYWAQQGDNKLKTLAPTDLTAVQKEMYPHAQRFVNTLQEGGPRAITDIVPAASVPKSNGDKNAFGNSYSYDPVTGVLNIRAERLENPGEMMLVLAHATAHIKSGDMSDDSSPEFQREFYKSLIGLMGYLGTSSNDGTPGGTKLPQITAEQELQRTTAHLLEETTRLQAQSDADHLERRETKRVDLERKRTEMRKKAGNLVKDNVKGRLSGSAVQDASKLRAQKGALKKLFESIDTQHKGKISLEEFTVLVQDVGVKMSAEQILAAFTAMDTNHDNWVDFDETYAWYCGS